MKKYFYFAIVSLVMFSCENEDLDEISSKANNTANIAPLSSLYIVKTKSLVTEHEFLILFEISIGYHLNHIIT